MNILIVAKQSKYEWERQKLGLGHDELVDKYNSHIKQVKVREQIANAMPDAVMCMMDDAPFYLTDANIKSYDWDLILVLGGDNSFTFVAQWAATIPVLGVNSDPERSVGCLTRWAIHDVQSIYDMIEMLEFNEFDIHEWPRLSALLDNKAIVSASNEYFIGERQSNKMSRHILVHKNKEYEQKCSGILVCTGAGSTGWYSSVRGKQAVFDPTWNVGAFVVREPYDPSDDGCYAGEIGEDDELILYSLNDDEGMISVDSWKEYPFIRGSEIRIHLGCPLNVIVPRDTHG